MLLLSLLLAREKNNHDLEEICLALRNVKDVMEESNPLVFLQ